MLSFLASVILAFVFACYTNEISQLAPIHKKIAIGLFVLACIVIGLIHFFHETLLSSIGNVFLFFSANPEVWLLILVVSLIIFVVYGVIRLVKTAKA